MRSRKTTRSAGAVPVTAPFRTAARWILRLLIPLGIGAALLVLLHRAGFDLLPDADVLRGLDLRWFVASQVCVALAFVVRAARMRHLVAPVPLREIFAIEWWSHAANFLLPLRLGELVRPGLYARRGGMPMTAAMASSFADRLLEGLVLLVPFAAAIPLGAPLRPLPETIGTLPVPTVFVPVYAYLVIGAYLAVFALLLSMQRAPSFLPGRFERLAEQLAAGLSFLRSPAVMLLYLTEVLAFWVLSVAGFVCLTWAVGIEDIGVVRAWAVIGTTALGAMLPAAPGYLGTYQLAAYAGLALYLPAEMVLGAGADLVAMVYVLAWLQMAVFAALGAWLVTAGRRRWR